MMEKSDRSKGNDCLKNFDTTALDKLIAISQEYEKLGSTFTKAVGKISLPSLSKSEGLFSRKSTAKHSKEAQKQIIETLNLLYSQEDDSLEIIAAKEQLQNENETVIAHLKSFIC